MEGGEERESTELSMNKNKERERLGMADGGGPQPAALCCVVGPGTLTAPP